MPFRTQIPITIENAKAFGLDKAVPEGVLVDLDSRYASKARFYQNLFMEEALPQPTPIPEELEPETRPIRKRRTVKRKAKNAEE